MAVKQKSYFYLIDDESEEENADGKSKFLIHFE